MRHWKVLAALLALVVVLGLLYGLGATVRAAWLALADAGETIGLTDDYMFAGQRDEDLVIFASTIALVEGSVVEGDAALVGNTIAVNGRISGELSATASQIVVGERARIDGDAAFTGESLRIDGAIAGDVVVSVEKVTIGAGSRLPADVRVCASIINDERLDAPPVLPCRIASPGLIAPVWAQGADWAGAALFALAAALAGGVLAALPHALIPLRLARLDEQLRIRPMARLISGMLILGLWALVAVVLLALPAGSLRTVILILFAGASLLVGIPTVWLGVALTGGWLGTLLVRVAGRPRTPAPLAALLGGLVLCGLLALVGPGSTLGLIGLALLALVGLAAQSAGRAARSAISDPRQTSFFVQG